jgi:hypothetical protein
MTVYDNDPQGRDSARSGYRPGWIWIPVAVVALLTALLIGVGFIYGGYNDRLRGYDNGTAIEQTNGDTTQPGAGSPQQNTAPELGNQPQGEERSSIPEAAPPLANDGQ